MNIHKVSEITGLSTYTLRYYEKVGLLHQIKKNASGIRQYSLQDISRIKFIKCMRDAAVSIKNLKTYIDLYDSNEDTFFLRKNLLKQEYSSMLDKYNKIREGLEYLEKKVELLEIDKLDSKLKKGGNIS